jgi:hypothetical protein
MKRTNVNADGGLSPQLSRLCVLALAAASALAVQAADSPVP